ncbi:MAG: DUF2283 domain-containing protein [bacterium]|nr:DUF2283 domain-containing protein [bacterium]
MNYDIEANLISWELAKDPIDHAIELGNFIIHLSKTKKPVLIEILNASKFVGQFDKIKKLKLSEPLKVSEGLSEPLTVSEGH